MQGSAPFPAGGSSLVPRAAVNLSLDVIRMLSGIGMGVSRRGCHREVRKEEKRRREKSEPVRRAGGRVGAFVPVCGKVHGLQFTVSVGLDVELGTLSSLAIVHTALSI